MDNLWLSCNKFTVAVKVKDGIVIETAPIVNKFKGQPIENLEKWMIKIGRFKKEKLNG